MSAFLIVEKKKEKRKKMIEFKESKIQWLLLKILFIYHFTFFLLHCLFYYYSGLNGWIMLSSWLLVGSTLYFVHRIAHQAPCTCLLRWWQQIRKGVLSKWYQIHIDGHHIRAYPAEQFQQEHYVVNEFDQSYLGTLVYIVPEAILLILIVCLLPLSMAESLHTISIAFFGTCIEELVHQQIHLKKSILDRFEMFQALRFLHFKHHRYFNYNFGVVNMLFDIFFLTLKTSDQREKKLV